MSDGASPRSSGGRRGILKVKEPLGDAQPIAEGTPWGRAAHCGRNPLGTRSPSERSERELASVASEEQCACAPARTRVREGYLLEMPVWVLVFTILFVKSDGGTTVPPIFRNVRRRGLVLSGALPRWFLCPC